MTIKTSRNIFGALVVMASFLYVIAVNFSTIDSRFGCIGSVVRDNTSQALKIYLKLSEYRWWVAIWSNSDGSMMIEVPNQTNEFISHIKRVGDQLQLFERDLTEKITMKGNFSTLSQSIAVSVDIGFYDGTCTILRSS